MQDALYLHTYWLVQRVLPWQLPSAATLAGAFVWSLICATTLAVA
jgi:hypothetical protein